jgi:hypothetical protein
MPWLSALRTRRFAPLLSLAARLRGIGGRWLGAVLGGLGQAPLELGVLCFEGSVLLLERFHPVAQVGQLLGERYEIHSFHASSLLDAGKTRNSFLISG